MLKKCKISDIPTNDTKKWSRGCRIADIEDFIASEADCAEIILGPNEIPKNVQSAFLLAINRREYYKNLCRVIIRENRVFLVRHEDKRVTKEENQC